MKTPTELPPQAAYWNTKAMLPKVLAMSPTRLKRLAARLKDPFWAENYEAAVDKMALSDFCTGRNGRGWRADFDFILQDNALVKVMEGKYDNREVQSAKPMNSDVGKNDTVVKAKVLTFEDRI